MTEHLDAFERDQLRHAERTIRRDLKAFVRCGEALLTIRDSRLHRETHATFEDYCRDRWQISKTHANRLVQAAAVMRELPAESAPTSERQARELAPLLTSPGVMRRAWATVVHRTGGKPTARDVRDVVRETIPQTPASPDASADAPGAAGAGAPAGLLRGGSAGDTRSTEPPASHRAGAGGGPAAGPLGGAPGRRSAPGAPDTSPLAPSGAPADPLSDPQPASPSGGPESGGQAAPSARSQAEGADGAPPSAGPVAEGGDAFTEPVLTASETHAALTDETCPLYLPDFGCRLALVHLEDGAAMDRAVVAAYRQSLAGDAL
ncbi:hypothetical protein [Actinomadura formosensis]|uniref:hypothetical protein n=1 Tax=Actinomadura formosensis TaxID=60706 RepID=UPI003D93FDCC